MVYKEQRVHDRDNMEWPLSWRGLRQVWRWVSGKPPLDEPARRLADHHAWITEAEAEAGAASNGGRAAIGNGGGGGAAASGGGAGGAAGASHNEWAMSPGCVTPPAPRRAQHGGAAADADLALL